jgi:primosomal protein N''
MKLTAETVFHRNNNLLSFVLNRVSLLLESLSSSRKKPKSRFSFLKNNLISNLFFPKGVCV